MTDGMTLAQLGHHIGMHVEVNVEGKKVEAIKRYRALNGATLDEARAYIAKLGG